MAMKPFNWTCPHCNHKVTISEDLYSTNFHRLWRANADGNIGISSQFLICPNGDCRKPTLDVQLRNWASKANGDFMFVGDPLNHWRLVPQGTAKPFPNYVPQAIRDDYKEACLIRDLSPKSSATLARRALQGILRDFYKVKPGRLVDEIKAVKAGMDPELWDAIDGLRKVGNIGAHMESDINVIVDVDPDEAELLIQLVESLMEETYVRRDARQKRLQGVAALAAAKEQERKGGPAAGGGASTT